MPAAELTVRQMMMPDPVVLRPDSRIQDALRVMNERRIGSVLVCDGEKLVGIFTERDLLKRVVTAIPGWRDYLLSDWMSSNPHVIGPDVGWNDAVGAMQKLLTLERAGKGLRELRFRTRLLNVERDLREAVAQLDRVLTEKK